jgi:signal transduction histidine kinase
MINLFDATAAVEPWYQMPLAPGLWAIAALLAIYVLYRVHLRQLEAVRRNLERAVAERTRELEQQKRTVEEQSQALLAADEQRRRFYAMVVHDLKNPLTPILGGLDLVAAGLREDFGPGQRALETLRQAAGRLHFLIETFTSSLRAGALEDHPERSEFQVRDLVSDLALSYAPAASKRGLRFLVDGAAVDQRWFPPRGGSLVRAPSNAIYRALENILNNALKYAASQILMRVDEADERIGIFVENDGPSISGADKQRIFDLYQRLADEAAGSGVGLASARHQVEGIGGEIQVHDVAPKGVRFEVWMPRATATPPA